MDLARAKTKSPEELTSIWDDYHLGRGHIRITMKAQLYRLLEQRASECRYFVIPLWRGNGYITMFAQVEAPHMIFTGLEDYKARGTQAAPYLTTTFYNELSETKDLVFIRGDVVFTTQAFNMSFFFTGGDIDITFNYGDITHLTRENIGVISYIWIEI